MTQLGGARAKWNFRRSGASPVSSNPGGGLLRRFADYRILSMLYAGRPCWDLLAAIAPPLESQEPPSIAWRGVGVHVGGPKRTIPFHSLAARCLSRSGPRGKTESRSDCIAFRLRHGPHGRLPSWDGSRRPGADGHHRFRASHPSIRGLSRFGATPGGSLGSLVV